MTHGYEFFKMGFIERLRLNTHIIILALPVAS